MRIVWRGLELPSRVQRDDSASTDKYGRFIIEPFERGFGTTVGNSLRRILLSSLEGSAVTHMRLGGADHEFTSLPGVVEDVTDIVLNVKFVIVSVESDTPKRMRIETHGPREVRAGDLVCDESVTVFNPEMLIATLTDKSPFSMELTVARGRGYISAAENQTEDMPIGVIAVDSIFSPVTRVRYKTEETRVGQKTNYDRLIMEIWTKGTMRPEDSLVEAAKILRKHLNPFVQYHELGGQLAAVDMSAEVAAPLGDDEVRRKLAMPISALDLSVRSSNCLDAAKILTVGELATRDETQLLQIRSFGKTSLMEVKQKLAELGLSLGMQVDAVGASAVSSQY